MPYHCRLAPHPGACREQVLKLQVPFIQLPLRFDAEVLAVEVAALGEDAWISHPQAFAGNSMLPLIAVDGDAFNDSFAGPMLATPQLQACPYMTQTIASLGATVGRTRLMRLSGHAEVKRHVDQGYYWTERVRVHVPIVTQSTVRFDCGDATINMAAGDCWIFDTWRQHRVINDAVESRIHLVVDTVGSSAFWELVAHGRPYGMQAGIDGWLPRLVPPEPGAPSPLLALESVNVPSVMSPWELNGQFGLLFNDALPHPHLVQVQQLAGQLVWAWRGLWAQFGDSPEGVPHFRKVMSRFMEDAERPGPLVLRNGVDWYSAVKTRIALAAVGDEAPQRINGGYDLADRG
jgi:hypothetical protein